MIKKILKFIAFLIILFLLIVAYIGIIKPAYEEYKNNKASVTVDKSGERATSKNKVADNTTSADDEEEDDDSSSSNDNSEEDEFEPVILDDRILLYSGEINSNFATMFADTLIEDIDSETFSKVDIDFVNIEGISNSNISYSEDKDMYRTVLNEFKNSITSNDTYVVDFEYNKLKTKITKIIITKN